MSTETINLTIPFDFLLNVIAKLDLVEKQRLWEFLDTDLHGDDTEGLDPEEEAEVAQAYQEYEAGNYITLDEYSEQRAERSI
ncbi:MAG: hypothetical protein AAF152_08800 [Cyanobacteria bacterium P01_A01_bin.114]